MPVRFGAVYGVDGGQVTLRGKMEGTNVGVV